MSIQTEPGARPDSRPSEPRRTFSTMGGVGSMVITTSRPMPASRGVAAHFAPAASRSAAASRCTSWTTRSCPAARILRLMGPPMWPSPMKPTFMMRSLGLPLRRVEEGVVWVVPGGQHVGYGGRTRHAVGQGIAGGGTVVLVNQVSVLGRWVDPDGHDEQQALRVVRADYSVRHRVGDPSGHARLGGSPGQVAVAFVGDGGLVHEQGQWFDREVGLEHGDERRVAGSRHGQRGGPGGADRSVPVAKDRVDVRCFGALADEALTDQDGCGWLWDGGHVKGLRSG